MTKEEDIEVYLQALSQRVYNIDQIIITHCKPPVEIDKELMRFYNIEVDKFKYLLSKQPERLKFTFDISVLKYDLVSNHHDTKQDRERIEDAKNKLHYLLAKIQRCRTSTATTGVEEGPLKDHLDFIINKKEDIIVERILRTQKTPEIKHVDNRTYLGTRKDPIIEARIFPEGLTWMGITIKFLNNNEVIINTSSSEPYQTSCDQIGFKDHRKKGPNKQWELLKLLSMKGGTLNWRNNSNLTTREVGNIKAKKSKLTKILKNYFHSVEGDPFFDYRKVKAYTIKIKLVPEHPSEVTSHNELDFGSEDYFNNGDI